MSNIPTKLSLSSLAGKAEVTNSQDFDKDINLQPTFEDTEETTDDIGSDQYQFKVDKLHDYPNTNIQQLQPQFISNCDDGKRIHFVKKDNTTELAGFYNNSSPVDERPKDLANNDETAVERPIEFVINRNQHVQERQVNISIGRNSDERPLRRHTNEATQHQSVQEYRDSSKVWNDQNVTTRLDQPGFRETQPSHEGYLLNMESKMLYGYFTTDTHIYIWIDGSKIRRDQSTLQKLDLSVLRRNENTSSGAGHRPQGGKGRPRQPIGEVHRPQGGKGRPGQPSGEEHRPQGGKGRPGQPSGEEHRPHGGKERPGQPSGEQHRPQGGGEGATRAT